MISGLKKLLPDQHPLRLLWHRSKALLAALQCGFPARNLVVIGITGTDGKTTTVGMVAHILNESGYKTAALSTAFFQIGKKVEWNATQKTSPSPLVIQQFLKRALREGCTHVVLECSSHGLVQGRSWFTWPMVAAITNISEEHLDYHGTMEEYIRAKSLLFKMLRKNDGVKVLNRDDRSYPVCSRIQTAWTIETSVKSPFPPESDNHKCGFWISNIEVTPRGSKAELHVNTEKETWPLSLSLVGAFNLQNALCAIGCAHGAGVSEDQCAKALASFTGVPGRLERIDAGQNFSVFVDFTVTPQSYQATLSTLKQMLPPGKKLLVLMGSCGDRMKEKRPIIGKIASEFADILVVANEDPYTEDPQKIIDEVWAGIDQSKTEAHQIFDRRKAMEFLFSKAQSDDIVILCGKGSDTTMWVKTGQIPWNEREIAREILDAM